MALACPGCGVDVRGEAVNVALDTACCPRCGEAFVPSAVLHGDGLSRPEHPSEPPPGLEVMRFSGGGIQVSIPRAGFSGRSLGMVFFAAFWNLISWVVFGSFIRIGMEGAPVFVLPLVSIFPLIGVVLAVAAVWMVFGTAIVEMDRRGLVIIQQLFGWKRRVDVPLEQIDRIDEQSVYTQNDQPVLGVAVHFGKRQRKFGSTLTDVGREWLVAEMNSVLRRFRSRSR